MRDNQLGIEIKTHSISRIAIEFIIKDDGLNIQSRRGLLHFYSYFFFLPLFFLFGPIF